MGGAIFSEFQFFRLELLQYNFFTLKRILNLFPFISSFTVSNTFNDGTWDKSSCLSSLYLCNLETNDRRRSSFFLVFFFLLMKIRMVSIVYKELCFLDNSTGACFLHCESGSSDIILSFETNPGVEVTIYSESDEEMTDFWQLGFYIRNRSCHHFKMKCSRIQRWKAWYVWYPSVQNGGGLTEYIVHK